MMIATHPRTAARIRDCNPSEGGLAASLLRMCKTTIQDVGIRCAGLLEIGRIWEDDTGLVSPWYGGEYSYLAPYASTCEGFRFVHRTARDFLTDTEEGRKILDASTVSEWHVLWRLVEAHLASCRLVRCPPNCLQYSDGGTGYLELALGRTLPDCLASIASLLDAPPEGDEDNARAKCGELLGFCEQLFNSGQLFGDRRLLNNTKNFQEEPNGDGASYEVAVMRRHEFLLETASLNLNLWPFILAEVEARSLDDQTLSELLLQVCNMGTTRQPGFWPPMWRGARKSDIFVIETRLKLAKLLLERGACPMWKGPRRVNGDSPTGFLDMVRVHLLETPLNCLLSSVWHLEYGGYTLDSNTASHLVGLIQLLISHGAVLDGEDSELRVTYRVSGGLLAEVQFYWNGVGQRTPPGEIDGMLFVMAYPASAILAKLLQTWGAHFSEIEVFPETWGCIKDGVEPGRLVAILHPEGTPEHMWYVESEEELEEELLWVTHAAQYMLQAHDRGFELFIPVGIQEGILQALERRRPKRVEGSVEERLFKVLKRAGMTSIYWEWEEGSTFRYCLFGS